MKRKQTVGNSPTSFLKRTISREDILKQGFVAEMGNRIFRSLSGLDQFINEVEDYTTNGFVCNVQGEGKIRFGIAELKAAMPAAFPEMVQIAKTGRAWLKSLGFESAPRPLLQEQVQVGSRHTGAAALVTPSEEALPGEPPLKKVKVTGNNPKASGDLGSIPPEAVRHSKIRKS